MESLHGFDRLSKVIEDLQMDPDRNTLVEAEVSSNVRRVLNALGWEADNHHEVKPEYSVGNRKVGYALLIGSTPQVFVEVKKGGEPLEHHQEQLLQYAFKENIRLALLTNGTVWWFYLPRLDVNWEQRRFATISLDEWEKAEIVRVLADVLGKENVENGSALQNADDLHKKMQRQTEVSKQLSEAWNQLIDEPDELIAARLQEKTGELYKHEPDENEVKEFMKTHREDIRIPPTPFPLAPDEAPDGCGKNTATRLAVTLPDGTKIDDKTAASTFVKVIDRLGRREVKNLNLKINGADLMSTSEDDQQRIKLGGYYINVGTSTSRKKKILEDIASRLGVTLEVEIIPK